MKKYGLKPEILEAIKNNPKLLFSIMEQLGITDKRLFDNRVKSNSPELTRYTVLYVIYKHTGICIDEIVEEK